MNLGFCPLASSSQGNSYLIKSEETVILLDAGISGKGLTDRMAELKMHQKNINGVVITHEHIDHIKGLGRILSFSDNNKLYCSKGTYDGIKEKHNNIPEEKVCLVAKGEVFTVGDIEVTAFEVSHDSAEPLAFSFKRNGKKISIVTDTGMVTPEIEEAIGDSDILIIESNHEENILLYGRYPYHVKRRILSDVGHLSNEVAGKCICKYIKTLSSKKIPYVFLAHLSKENNTPLQAVLTVRNVLEESNIYVGKDLRMEVIKPNEMGKFLII